VPPLFSQLWSIASANPRSQRITQECLSLENKLGHNGATELVMEANTNPQSLQAINKQILKID